MKLVSHASPEMVQQPPEVNFTEAFRFWAKLGFISFGGPAGQIAIMHRELVERRRWLSEERFLYALNYCMMLPGPEAQQLATYIGWLLHGIRGGIVAGALFVLPSIAVLLVLSYIYAAYGNVTAVAGALSGLKPVVVAIVFEAMLRIGKRAVKKKAHLLIAALAFIAIYFLKVPFPVIVLAAALTGFVLSRLKNNFNNPAQHQGLSQPLPNQTDWHSVTYRPSLGRTFSVLVVGIILWLLPFALVVLWSSWDSLHATAYRFFTKAAFVTFGGAYAVLAYVTQAAGSYGWITQTQAVDGLGLAETTPGPLIMVLQFIGFMAGWNHAGSMNQTASAVLGALVATYATFLPSFIFIFVGAPYIEVLRNNQGLTGALAGITAAVVGVVLNLALVFGLAVVWPSGIDGQISWFAAFLSGLAFVALYWLKVEVLWVVLIGGLIGVMRGVLFN